MRTVRDAPLIKRQEQQPMCRDNAARLRPQSRPAAADPILEFGRFRVLLRQRQLLADQVPIELGTRAFDLLLVLLEADGSLVTKDELISWVWPGIVVSEENLKVQVSALRKALGEDRDIIRTEFGRGYRFTGVVHATAAASGHFAPPSRGSEPAVMPPTMPRSCENFGVFTESRRPCAAAAAFAEFAGLSTPRPRLLRSGTSALRLRSQPADHTRMCRY